MLLDMMAIAEIALHCRFAVVLASPRQSRLPCVIDLEHVVSWTLVQ